LAGASGVSGNGGVTVFILPGDKAPGGLLRSGSDRGAFFLLTLAPSPPEHKNYAGAHKRGDYEKRQ
jgi:hypothetical protein